MAEFSESSLWMRLTMMFLTASITMHLFSMDGPGWSRYTCFDPLSAAASLFKSSDILSNPYNNPKSGGCGGADDAVKAMEVIGFLAILAAFCLSIILVLLDEVKGNKICLICLIVASFVAGVFIIIGISVYEGSMRAGIVAAFDKYGDYGSYSLTMNMGACSSFLGIIAGFFALAGGVFGILEVVGVAIPKQQTTVGSVTTSDDLEEKI